MATHHIPEIDEVFERARARLAESIADALRDLRVLSNALKRPEDAAAAVEAVESDRLLRKLPDDADVM